jgi:hypothetical protein
MVRINDHAQTVHLANKLKSGQLRKGLEYQWSGEKEMER